MQVSFKIKRQKQRHQQDQIFLHFIGFLRIIKNGQGICANKTVNSCRQDSHAQKEFSPDWLPRIFSYHGKHKQDDCHKHDQQTTANISDIVFNDPDYQHVTGFHDYFSERSRCLRLDGEQHNPKLPFLKHFGNVYKIIIFSAAFCLCILFQIILINYFTIKKNICHSIF